MHPIRKEAILTPNHHDLNTNCLHSNTLTIQTHPFTTAAQNHRTTHLHRTIIPTSYYSSTQTVIHLLRHTSTGRQHTRPSSSSSPSPVRGPCELLADTTAFPHLADVTFRPSKNSIGAASRWIRACDSCAIYSAAFTHPSIRLRSCMFLRGRSA